jgi:Omp85 superfamily domain
MYWSTLCALALLATGHAAAAEAPRAAAAADPGTPAPPAATPPAPAGPAPATPAPAAPAQTASGLRRWFDPATAPFIPIPDFDTEPHNGLTLGVIPTWLHTNSRDEIERIVAPDIIHNQYFGWGAHMRVLGYPSADTQWSVVGGLKQRVEREFDGRYITGLARASAYSWSIETIYDRSGTPRFFGLGNRSLRTTETSYVDNQALVAVSIGRNLSPRLQLAYLVRPRYVEVLPAVLSGLPSTETLYPALKGVGREHEVQHSAMLTYDTRDSLVVPHSGARYIVYDGFVSRAFGSSVSYTFFGAEARHYWGIGPDVTLAWHAALRYMPSADNAPFWALSSLGGDRSVLAEREPLRGYGTDRFIDRNMFATGLEARARIVNLNAFGTRLSVEAAPFLDVGKVFAALGASPVSQLHATPGLGVRGVASPYVVGYLDFGLARGRVAIFSGIDYPF